MEMIKLEMPIFKEPDNLLPDPDLFFFYKDLEHRHIWLDEEITWDSVCLMIKYIKYLNRAEKNDRTPITIHIASPGGELSTMFTLYETILKSKIPVHTVNEGGAHSAAFIIFLAGHKRSMLPSSYFIAHEGSAVLGGSHRETKAQMKQYEIDVGKMRNIITTRTAFTQEEIEKRFESEQDFYIDYEMALEKNVITEE